MRKRKENKEETKKQEVESYYYQDITFTCPKRGKVTEQVRVKRMKPQSAPDKQVSYELDILKSDHIADE